MAPNAPSLHYHPFVKRIAWGLRVKCQIQENESILIAVSGGADSVALLHAMAILSPRRRWNLKLTVGHINHHLRPEADSEARFVEELAQKLGIPFLQADIDPLGEAPENLEAAGRDLRYMALARMAKKASIPFIATAHHSDDQIETVLMRLLRGASVQGLAGIAWRRRMAEDRAVSLIRPMLVNDHAMAKKFLVGIGQTWCEDASNEDVSKFRARLRHEVLPVLKSLRPNVGPLLVAEGEHLRRVANVLDFQVLQATKLVTTHGAEASAGRAELAAMNRAVLSGFLRRLLIQQGCDRDHVGGKVINPIVKAIRDHQGGVRSFQLSGGVAVHVSDSTLSIRRRQVR